MPRRPALPRRLVTTALWPFGIALTSWDYMWRTTPLHRRERAGSPAEDGPPPLPAASSADDVQHPADGVGPLYRRRYRARITGTGMRADEIVAALRADPNRAAPSEFARFHKVGDGTTDLRPGDEYVVRMPGPWDGPVRVVEATPTSFRFVTLRGHLEAGQIEFRAEPGAGGDVVFTIESWARSGDRLSRLLYQDLRMAKEVQLHMWTSFLERVARLSGGRLSSGIDVETRRVEEGDGRPSRDPRARRILDGLHERGLNFDVATRDRMTADRGWRVDHYREALRAEAPGPPAPGGTWEVARGLMRDYEFADPAIVLAVYHPDRDLRDRDMVLEARWHGLRFFLGVRVGGVADETRSVDGRSVRVWGWNYRTLQGHLEMGQMDFEVWKWTDTGEVEFRICAVSRSAPLRNPVVRLGLRLFGRREQVRFARRACERMARLTAAALDGGDVHAEPRVPDEVLVRSVEEVQGRRASLRRRLRSG